MGLSLKIALAYLQEIEKYQGANCYSTYSLRPLLMVVRKACVWGESLFFGDQQKGTEGVGISFVTVLQMEPQVCTPLVNFKTRKSLYLS
jgi:hypothetical protein